MEAVNPTHTKPPVVQADKNNPLSPELVDGFLEWLAAQTPEELAERITTYEPGIPHFFHGQPVEPITKEQLLGLSPLTVEEK